MTNEKRNINFAYLYRDAGNYKQRGHIVFSNPEGLDVEDLDHRLRRAMMIDSTFMADQVRVPSLFLFDMLPINEDDHCLHEFYFFKIVEDRPNDQYERSISEFVEEVERASLQGWEGFVPGHRLTHMKRFKFVV